MEDITMVGKRKSKRLTADREDLSKPSKWRLQHGRFSAPGYDVDPETGAVVVHRRAVDTLGMMLANDTIAQEMHDAGALFGALFRKAAIEHVVTSTFLRMPGRRADHLSETSAHARIKIADAMDVLGGHDTAAGSCAWYVLGCGASVREWAIRRGWGGRPVAPPQAQGMLVATLSVLAAHFGMVTTPRAA